MALSLDGSVNGNATATSVSVTLSTTNSNDIIVVDVLCNGGPIVSSGVTATGLTFTRHAQSQSAPSNYERWWAVASSPLSSVSITGTQTSSNFITMTAFGVSGANTTSPWDAGGPVTSTASPSDPLSITTVNANTMAIAGFRMSGTSSPTAGSGFTLIQGANFQAVEYQILSSAQTLSCTLTTGAAGSNGGVVDAIVAAPFVPPAFTTIGIGGSEW